MRRDSRLLLQVSRATGSVVSMVQRSSIMAEEASRCAVSVEGTSIVDRAVRGAFVTYKATRTRPSFGSSKHKQSRIFRVLNYEVQIDGTEDVRCYCLDVGHQSWRPAEFSYISSANMVQHTFNAVRASMSLVDRKQKCKLHAPGPFPSSSG